MHAHSLSCFSCVQLSVTLWTVTHKAPLSMGFSHEYSEWVARTLEWIAMLSSRGSSWSRDWTQVFLCLLQWQAGFSFFFFLTTVLSGKPPMYPAAAAAAKSLQSCPTLCDPIDGSPPGSAVPGILQARTLEWVAISFSTMYPKHAQTFILFIWIYPMFSTLKCPPYYISKSYIYCEAWLKCHLKIFFPGFPKRKLSTLQWNLIMKLS